jgi:hypothetical protein
MTRKKFALPLLAALIVSAVLPSGGAAASGNLFLAVNEHLYPLTTTPVYYSGGYYVPSSIFSEVGVYCNYFSGKSIALVYNSSVQFYFDMETGSCRDGSDTEYAVSAIFQGGGIYLPVGFICSGFGLNWSYIDGNEYGDVFRITSSSAVLTDTMFLSAANSQMKLRAEEMAAQATPFPAPPPLTPSSAPPVITTAPPESGGGTIYLSFAGAPSDEILRLLDTYSYTAAFFVSAGDVLAAPDMIRRAVSRGHRLGILLDPDDPEASLAEAREIIFETAHTATLLAASADDTRCESFALENGLVYKKFGLISEIGVRAITDALGAGAANVSVRVNLSDEYGADVIFAELADYLSVQKFTVKPLLEV